MTNFSCQHELLLAPSGTQLLYVEPDDGVFLISANFSTSVTNIKYSRKTRFHFNGSDNFLATDNFFSPS